MRATLFALMASAAMAACAAPTRSDPPKAAPAAGAAPAASADGKKQGLGIALKNAGFESAARKSERCPEGWECTMHSNADSFRFTVEAPEGAQGKQALCIERVIGEPWALVTQSVPAAALRGSTLRFSVAVRVERTDGAGGGPWAVVHGPSANLAHQERPVKATKGWERIAVEVPVGATAQIVEVGATLVGGGRICIDDARLEVRPDQ